MDGVFKGEVGIRISKLENNHEVPARPIRRG
jgi:hypothetical protein